MPFAILGNPLVVPALEHLDGGQQVQAAFRARLANPEARIARRRSQTAFEHLRADAAARLAASAFPGIVRAPSASPPKLSAGERIVRYIGPNAAAVSLPHGKYGVIESLEPMARPTGRGRYAPLDMALSDRGSAYVPASSALGMRIPKRLADGIELPGAGVSLTPSDAHGAPLPGAPGSLDGASVFYANTQADSDTLVKPLADGFEIDAVLRSIDSPSHLYFRVGMPAGARLVGDGASSVRVVRGGATIATVAAPFASDSAGQSVPLTVSVRGGVLDVGVKGDGAERQYPIVVDPYFVEDNQLTGANGVAHPTRWKFCSTGDTACTGQSSTKFKSVGWGLTGGLTDEPIGTYLANEFVSLNYQTQGESRINEVFVPNPEATGSNPSGNVETVAQLFTGAIGEPTQVESTLVVSSPPATSYATQIRVCGRLGGVENCSEGGAEKNVFRFEQSFTGSGTSFKDTISKPTVYIHQAKNIEASFNTSSPTIEYEVEGKKFTRPNAMYGSGGWLGPNNDVFEVQVKDPGIGIKYFSVAQGPKWKKEYPYYEKNECEGVQCPGSVGVAYTYNSEMADGEAVVKIGAENSTGAGPISVQLPLKVDGTAPYGLSLTGLPASGEVLDQPYKLQVHAADGSGSTPSSGIKSITVGVDGFEIGKPSAPCTPGPCEASGEWTLSGEGLGVGEHVLTVVATDNANNVASKEYPFFVRHPAPLSVSGGSVNPVNGAFTLTATDVSIGGGEGSLAVSRSYNSTLLTAGAEGPMGPQWSVSTGGEEKLEKTSSGDGVVLVGSDGGMTMFKSNGSGGFTAPKGDANLSLTEVIEGGKTKEFLLKDPAAGTTTHFTLPSGSTGSAYLPTIAEGVTAATGMETYAFQTVEVESKKITEPKQALAPVPSGVSCSPTLTKGCRALTFNYATSTTATGEEPSQWGDYNGRMTRVYFTAWEPTKKEMVTTTVAQYSYDSKGRLRAVWDPRISPALKTTYGYDAENHVVALSAPGQQPVFYRYGSLAGDTASGRLLSATRPAASTALFSGAAPVNTVVPTLSTTSPTIGTTLSVSSNGTWSNSPLAYSYQWDDCSTTCTPIPGAVNQSYTPQAHDGGFKLAAFVSAVNSNGATVASTAWSGTIPLPAYSFTRAFGSLGSGNGQFSHPMDSAVDAQGNVWVSDANNNRIEKFSATGEFSAAYGSSTVFKGPAGIAISQATGHIYVADQQNNSVHELNETGEVLRTFGAAGAGNGQLKTPIGLALDSEGNVWVADSANNRVEEFSGTGIFMRTFGAAGTGNGQFKTPTGVAVSGENVFVTDQGNNRVQKFTLAGAYVAQWGTAGTGVGQFSSPTGMATDPVTGDLYVVDRGNGRVQGFTPLGVFVTTFGSKGTGNGQFTEPEGVGLSASGIAYAVDTGDNRVEEFSPTYSKNNPAPSPPSVGTSIVATVDYGVPVSGSGAPYQMTEAELAKWSQTDDPIDATAVFPPDSPQGWPAQSYTRATITYLDDVGDAVNVAAPGGGIATTEYNELNEPVRSLSASNRATALKEGAKSAEVSKLLDSQDIYNEEGTEVTETLGPQHSVKLSSGTEVLARLRTAYFYDEGAPAEGGPYRLVTKKTEGAKYSGGEADVRTTTMGYAGQSNLGWKLRKPTSVTTDPSGLKLTTTTIYDPVTGNVTETRAPGAGVSNGPTGAYAFASQVTMVPVALKKADSVKVDPSGNVWVSDTESNRVEEFSSTGEFITTFGSAGTGNGQFKSPHGLAADSSGHVWVVDFGNNRIEEFSSTGGFLRSVGTSGTGAGQFEDPTDVAIDPSGHIWVADCGNKRLEEFSSEGSYIGVFGSTHFNGCFVEANMWLTFDSSGNLWATEESSPHIKKFNSSGTFVTEYGSEGSGNGQLKSPQGIATDSSGNVWVTDGGNNRVEKFSAAGVYQSQFGTSGTGNGQFKGALGLTVNSSGNVWVADAGNNRLQELTSTGTFVTSITTAPTALKKPGGSRVDSSGNVWITDTESNRIEEYSSAGAYMTSFGSEGTGNVQFKSPHGLAVDSSGHVWVADTNNNRIEELSTSGSFIRAFGSAQLSSPWDVAVDSSGHVWVADCGNARVAEFTSEGSYMGAFGSQFIGCSSGATMWLTFDPSGHLWVSESMRSILSKDSLVEFSSTGSFMGEFGLEGSGNGQLKRPTGIATDSEGHLWVTDAGNNRVEELSSSGSYLTQFASEGTAPGQLASGASGLAVSSSGAVWVADTKNNRIQSFTLTAASAKVAETIYYSSTANASYPSCGEHAEWAGLVCQTQAAAQPAASAAPKIPVTTIKYNMWDEAESTVETVGTTTRTKTTTYDGAGRETGSSISSTVGTALPTTKDEYNETTGALIKQSTTVSEKTKTVTTTLNTLGQVTSYADADSNTSTYTYNVDGQVEEMSDGKGTYIYAYDTTTHTLIKLLDTAAGTFTATYDVEGRITSETYPNGMSANYTYDNAGGATALEYVKTTHCTEKCVWYNQSAASSIHGEMLSMTSTLANDSYAYDAAGRLTETSETPTGAGCKVRVYAYDVESNRMSLTSREPGLEGKCATTGGTVESHTYDEANRLIDTGISYDTFGDTLKLPAADAGGNEVTSAYYTSGQLQSQTQSGKTLTYNLDPANRIRETVTTGSESKTVVSHYTGDGGSPAWTSESAEKWSRNIVGIDGALAAIQTNGETPVLQLHDLQGDVVGTAALSELETKLLSSYNSTEFGVPTTSSPPRYSWQGASGTATELSSGITNSDTTSYVPQLGRALQTESIVPPGASPDGVYTATPYVTQMEPWVGQSDAAWGAGSVEREAARQAAAAAETAAKAATIEGEEEGGDPHCRFQVWMVEEKGYMFGRARVKCDKLLASGAELEVCVEQVWVAHVCDYVGSGFDPYHPKRSAPLHKNLYAHAKIGCQEQEPFIAYATFWAPVKGGYRKWHRTTRRGDCKEGHLNDIVDIFIHFSGMEPELPPVLP
jgi:YD repeat-containing protein